MEKSGRNKGWLVGHVLSRYRIIIAVIGNTGISLMRIRLHLVSDRGNETRLENIKAKTKAMSRGLHILKLQLSRYA